jgi:hypothetical protein
MKTSLNIDEELLVNASELTGINDKNTLIKAGLEALLTKQHQQRVSNKKPTKKSSEYFPKKRYQKFFSTSSYLTPNKALSKLINHYGTSLCEEPKRCEALLRDSCGGKHQREISLLVNALKEKITVNLLNPPLWLSKNQLFSHLTARLHKGLGLDKKLSAWAVSTWANSLNKISRRFRLSLAILAISFVIVAIVLVYLLAEPTEIKTQIKIEPIVPQVIENKQPEMVEAIKAILLTIRSNVYHDKVFINGKAYGATPVYNIELVPGLYTLRIEKPNYIPFEQRINLQQTKTIRVKLRRRK